ncbi:SRPBCC domain-containing protein [Bacillus paralicheniformis]|uniref:SRPBCC family protein n=1 Tax=Bacillus paralicheniformis TaxID=1648923 RepID=UPI0013EF1B25|nr:SRPBCC domain-containing protein [Bacillus paralicheniformis]QII47431.1 SRPBCC domain-containing protein [Bacillus paralicheniformis]
MSDHKEAHSVQGKSEGKTLVMERSFEAPRELVFKAFSESAHLESWWGPKGWQTANSRFEFQPDGVWLYCMECRDENQGEFYGRKSCGKAVFQEIAAPERIVYTDMFTDEEGNVIPGMPEILIEVYFKEHGEQTNLITRSHFSSPEELQQLLDKGIAEGFSSQLDRLEDYLKAIR